MLYLKAGELFISGQPGMAVTVLGSCLSITMFSRSRRLGGICHVVLPRCGEQEVCRGECPDGFKYVDCSIVRMLKFFELHQVRRSELEVKCFGGADMFAEQSERPGCASIGRQNISAAERIMKREGLKPAAVDVGGFRGRKIFFYFHTGEVLLKRLVQ